MVQLFQTYLNADVMPVFTSFKVASYFSLKCQTPYPYRSNVVYQFKCQRDADTSYIGETTRHLSTRVKEHLKYEKTSQVYIHVSQCQECQNANLGVSNFSLLKKCRTEYESRIHESILINKLKPNLNARIESKGKLIRLITF